MSYPVDQPIRLTFRTYSDAAQTTLADATAVTLYVRDPAGTETTPTVTHDSTGTYHYDLTPSLAGHYSVHWKATGAVATATDEGFDVDPRYGPWISQQDVDDDLNLTGAGSSELRGIIDAACSILENHPAYTVSDNVKRTVYTEWHDGGDTIVLHHVNVDPDSVTVTEYQGSTSQALTYEPLDGGSFTGYGWATADGTGASGILVRSSSGYPARFCGRVKVTYTAGVTTVPADLRLAALLLVEHLWETQRGTQGSGLPEGFEDQLGAGEGLPYGQSFLLPNRVKEALSAYRRAPAIA